MKLVPRTDTRRLRVWVPLSLILPSAPSRCKPPQSASGLLKTSRKQMIDFLAVLQCMIFANLEVRDFQFYFPCLCSLFKKNNSCTSYRSVKHNAAEYSKGLSLVSHNSRSSTGTRKKARCKEWHQDASVLCVPGGIRWAQSKVGGACNVS